MSRLIKKVQEPDIHAFEDDRLTQYLFVGVVVAYCSYFSFLLFMPIFINYLYAKYINRKN